MPRTPARRCVKRPSRRFGGSWSSKTSMLLTQEPLLRLQRSEGFRRHPLGGAKHSSEESRQEGHLRFNTRPPWGARNALQRDSKIRDHIGVTRKQPPRTPFVLPNVREAALDRVPGHEASAWRVADWLHRL